MDPLSPDSAAFAFKRVVLNRIEVVRKAQGVKKSALAKKLGLASDEMKLILDPRADLEVSMLHRVAEALGVPLEKILIDPRNTDPLFDDNGFQALFETGIAIEALTKNEQVQRMAQLFLEQVQELAALSDAQVSRPSDIPALLKRLERLALKETPPENRNGRGKPP